jgi:hypothetical protein
MKPKDSAPDLLSQLHTLRSLAHDVKRTADAVRAWQIAAIVATVSEEVTIAIDRLNATDHQANAAKQP